MAVQPTFLLIADIGGYTRFMKLHRMSLAHAQDIVGRLLESLIESAGKRLVLAKLEGDAAFFYLASSPGSRPDLTSLSDEVADIYRGFHARIEDMRSKNLCWCDGCTQAGNLKIKFAAHLGEAAVQRVKQWTELAGLDVIVVHRMLKNDVPIPEYLLMTRPVLDSVGSSMRESASALAMEVADVGRIDAFFVDMARYAGEVPPRPRRPLLLRICLMMALAMRTMPYLIGVRRPCAGFRNIEPSSPAA